MSMRKLTKLCSEQKSHCAVEYCDEKGKPVGVVMAKNVASAENEGHGNLIVGDPCKVSTKKGGKSFTYNATLLGIGTKNAMESLLGELVQERDEQDCVGEDEPSIEIPMQTARPVKTRNKPNRKRAATGKKPVSASKRAQLENSRASKELLDTLSIHSSSDDEREATHACGTQSATPIEDAPKEVTDEYLLSDLNGSPEHSTPPPTTPTLPLSPSLSPCLSPYSPKAHSSLWNETGHSERHALRDVTNRKQGDLERSFVTQLTLLRGWLETQFGDINNQFVEDSIVHLKESVMKKRSKKVQFDVAGNFGQAHVEIGDASFCPESSFEERRDTTERGPLEVCCGDPRKRSCVWVKVPSQAALSLFRELSAFPPKDPGRYALKLLSVFYSDDELAESNCTRAEGRKLIDQDVLIAIKEQTNYKFPLDGPQGDLRWHNIVSKVLNNKCRTCRKKLRARMEQEN